MSHFTYIFDEDTFEMDEIKNVIGDTLNITKPVIFGKRDWKLKFQITTAKARVELPIKKEWENLIEYTLQDLKDSETTFFHYGKKYGIDFTIAEWNFVNNKVVITMKLYQ